MMPCLLEWCGGYPGEDLGPLTGASGDLGGYGRYMTAQRGLEGYIPLHLSLVVLDVTVVEELCPP